ncbi:MAG: DUF4286 family protein [Gammaproteobacteria bacterium]
MPNYEVTLEVDPDRVGEMESYMRTEHIPEILRTGVFFARHLRTLGLGPFPDALRGGEPRCIGGLFPRPRGAPAPGLPEAFSTRRRAVTRSLDGGRTLE